MILQVQDVINDAMRLTGALDINSSPTAGESALLLRTANVMIDRWSTQRLMLRSSHAKTFSTTVGKASYTIGSSGLVTPDIIALGKPLSIQSATVTDQAGLDYTVEIIDKVTYNNLQDKNITTGQPIYLAYEPGDAQQTQQIGTIYLYYAPDRPYTMAMEMDVYLTEFVNLTDTVTFEPAYYEALIYNLAIRTFRLFRDASVPVPQEIKDIAGNSIANLKTLNSTQMIAGMEFPGKMAKWDIYSDSTAV